MDAIRFKNICLYAFHGVSEAEQRLGQRFYLDVELATDLEAAARSDDLSHTIDYQEVYQTITQAFTSSACRLIEHAGMRVATAILDNFPASEVTVRVRKPSAPIAGSMDAVEIELVRRREDRADA